MGAVARGGNHHGQCDIPPLEDGVEYSQVSAGHLHTVLLRSDGLAVAGGLNSRGQCDIPNLHTLQETLKYSSATLRKYVPDTSVARCAGGLRVLQLSCSEGGNGAVQISC